MKWIVIRQKSADRLACAFHSEEAAMAAMERWRSEGYAMDLVRETLPQPERAEVRPRLGEVPVTPLRQSPWTF